LGEDKYLKLTSGINLDFLNVFGSRE